MRFELGEPLAGQAIFGSGIDQLHVDSGSIPLPFLPMLRCLALRQDVENYVIIDVDVELVDVLAELFPPFAVTRLQ